MRNGLIKEAMEEALKALPDKERQIKRPYVPEAELALYSALQSVPRPLLTLKHDGAGAVDVQISSDGAQGLSVGERGKIRIWDLGSGKSIRNFEGQHAALSPDGKLIAIANGTRLDVLDLNGGSQIAGYDAANSVEFITFSRDSTKIGLAYAKDFAELLDAKSGAPIVKLQQPTDLLIHKLIFSFDGSRVLAIGNHLYTARVFDGKSGQEVTRLIGHKSTSPYGLLNTGEFSPDGKHIVTGASDNARLWDAQGRDAGVVDIASVRHAHFSPTGGRLLLASSSGQSKLFDTNTAKALKELTFANRPIVGAQYSSDGSRFLLADVDGMMHIFTGEGEKIATLQATKGYLSSAALAPDGKRVVSGSTDSVIQLWAVDSRPEIAVIPVPANANGLSFAADGKLYMTVAGAPQPVAVDLSGANDSQVEEEPVSISASPARSIRFERGNLTIWDTAQNSAVAHLYTLEQCQLDSPTVRPDGRLAAALCNGAIHIWRVFPSTQALVREARSVLAELSAKQ